MLVMKTDRNRSTHSEADVNLPMLVLCGGFGTRLKAVLPDTPKALAPINGIPFLTFLMDNWIRQGVTRFVFLLHFRAADVIDFLDQYKCPQKGNAIDISYVIESEPLGTGGAVQHGLMKSNIRDWFLLANSDTWLDDGILALMEGRQPSLIAVNAADVSRFGGLEIKDELVTNFLEKGRSRNPGWINAGTYLLHRDYFSSQKLGPRYSLETEILNDLAARGVLRALKTDCQFVDIGVPSDYKLFCSWVSTGSRSR